MNCCTSGFAGEHLGSKQFIDDHDHLWRAVDDEGEFRAS